MHSRSERTKTMKLHHLNALCPRPRRRDYSLPWEPPFRRSSCRFVKRRRRKPGLKGVLTWRTTLVGHARPLPPHQPRSCLLPTHSPRETALPRDDCEHSRLAQEKEEPDDPDDVSRLAGSRSPATRSVLRMLPGAENETHESPMLKSKGRNSIIALRPYVVNRPIWTIGARS